MRAPEQPTECKPPFDFDHPWIAPCGCKLILEKSSSVNIILIRDAPHIRHEALDDWLLHRNFLRQLAKKLTDMAPE
jgi:hypothetical protein